MQYNLIVYFSYIQRRGESDGCQGTGDNEGHTLISDGDKSARQFDARHNHYGPNREDDGYVTVTAVTTPGQEADLRVLSRDANSTRFHI